MSLAFFTSLSSQRIATTIRRAARRVCYVAPGLHDAPAAALAAVKAANPALDITVSVDFSEQTLRMGYGSLSAVGMLREAGIAVTDSPGFRSAILIVDDEGWTLTPTALYLEAEPQSDETPNAMRLTPLQLQEILMRLSPAALRDAMAAAGTPEEVARLASIRPEIGEALVGEDDFVRVKEAMDLAPPVKFDVARQVRVFEPYLQYVEITLSGAAVQRHRVRIPKTLHNLGASKDLEGKLKTTFDLVENDSSLSSKSLEDDLNDIRKNLTPSLGKDHGRVVLKAAKPRLLERLSELRNKLQAHQRKVESELQAKLDASKRQVVEYYLPLVRANPPDGLVGSLLKVTDDDIKSWIESELDAVFPRASKLIKGMTLEARYKDVTFETLNQRDFLDLVKDAFPRIDWDKPFDDFMAAGEAAGGGPASSPGT